MTLLMSLLHVISRLIAEIYNNDDHYCQSKVCHRLVEDEDENWFATDSALIDGDDGGDDHEKVEESLRDELEDGDDVEVGPDDCTSLGDPVLI